VRHHGTTDAYSEDPRRKLIDAVEQRKKKCEAGRAFSVSGSSTKRYVKAVCERRSLTQGKAPGNKTKLDEKARRLLETDIDERPFAKLRHRQVNLEQVAGVSVSESTLSRAIRRMGFDKKWTLGASERDEFLRAAFQVMVMRAIDSQRCVFVVEYSSDTSLAPLTDEREKWSGPTRWCPQMGQEHDASL
jgi:transposase